MIGAKSQKSIAGVAAFDQKKPFDAFVMGLNEPVQELVIHFSRPFQAGGPIAPGPPAGGTARP